MRWQPPDLSGHFTPGTNALLRIVAGLNIAPARALPYAERVPNTCQSVHDSKRHNNCGNDDHAALEVMPSRPVDGVGGRLCAGPNDLPVAGPPRATSPKPLNRAGIGDLRQPRRKGLGVIRFASDLIRACPVRPPAGSSDRSIPGEMTPGKYIATHAPRT